MIHIKVILIKDFVFQTPLIKCNLIRYLYYIFSFPKKLCVELLYTITGAFTRQGRYFGRRRYKSNLPVRWRGVNAKRRNVLLVLLLANGQTIWTTRGTFKLPPVAPGPCCRPVPRWLWRLNGRKYDKVPYSCKQRYGQRNTQRARVFCRQHTQS